MATDVWDMTDDQLEEAFRAAKAGDAGVGAEQNTTDDLEQPYEDSDDNVSTENDTDTVDETHSDATDITEEVVDESNKEQVSQETEVSTANKQPVTKRRFKANGQDYELTEAEILERFPQVFAQAMDYTKKTQAIKPWRKTIDALESAKVSHEDVNLMIDVLKGDKAAISEVLRKNNIDSLELDTEDVTYAATDYGRDEKTLAVLEAIEEIKHDPEYSLTGNILSAKWDSPSLEVMADNPELIKLLHVDVKSGMFQKLQPIINKLKVYDGGRNTDLQYYKMAAEELAASNYAQNGVTQEQFRTAVNTVAQAKVAEVHANEQRATNVQQQAVQRKAAAIPKKVAGASKVKNYLDDSDEDYEKWYAALQNKY